MTEIYDPEGKIFRLLHNMEFSFTVTSSPPSTRVYWEISAEEFHNRLHVIRDTVDMLLNINMVQHEVSE
jgi:hypothetical protein